MIVSVRSRAAIGAVLVAPIFLAAGCMESLGEQTKARGSIIGKKTNKVGEFDPKKQGQTVSKSEVSYTPLNPAGAYVPVIEKTAKLQIEHSLNLFNATHGRYPRDHEEFMEEIIKPGIQLPQLPADREYQYDVENRELVIVVQDQAE